MRKSLHKLIIASFLILISGILSAQEYQRTTKTLKSFDWLKTPVVENVDVKGGHHVIEIGSANDQVVWTTDAPTTVGVYITKFPNVFGIGTIITVPANNANTGDFITYRIKTWTNATTYGLEIAEETTSWGVGVDYAIGQSVLFEGRTYVALTAHKSTVATGTNQSPRYATTIPVGTDYNTTDWRPTATKLFSKVATRDLLGTGVYQNAYEGDMVLVTDNGTGESELFICVASDMAGVAQWYGVKTGFGMSNTALPAIKTFTAATSDESAITTAVTDGWDANATTLALNTDLGLTVDTYNVVAIPQSWGRKEFYIGTDRLIDGIEKYITTIDHDDNTDTASIPYQVWVLDFKIPTGTSLNLKIK